jgi:hypothetical protein
MAANLIQRMEFFGRIVQEGDYCAGTLAVAFVLLYRFYNGATGRCDPGQSAIAKASGITARHVKRASEDLKAGRWFDVRPGAGTPTRYGPTTAYQPLFERVTSSSGDDESVSGDESVTPDELVRRGVTSSSARTSKRTSNRVLAVSEDAAMQFETLWRVFPRREGGNPKKPAREKFMAALKRGVDPTAIIRGAENYAADVAQTGTAPKFVCQLVTWLNQERWDGYQIAPEPQEARLRAGMC